MSSASRPSARCCNTPRPARSSSSSSGGGEAWEAAGELAAAHVPVIIDNDINLPNSFSDIGATLKNAARLDAAGVVVAFQPQNDGPAHYARTITQIAGNAVANGHEVGTARSRRSRRTRPRSGASPTATARSSPARTPTS